MVQTSIARDDPIHHKTPRLIHVGKATGLLTNDADLAKEAAMQRLIADRPWLLPDLEEGPKAVAEEVRVSGAGRADVVVVDAKEQSRLSNAS